MAEFSFNYQGKKFSIDVEECRNFFQKARGLMFRKRSKSLLFIFKSGTKQAIHSLFCMNFIAVWFDNNKVVDVQPVESWRFFIKPNKKFNKLLEIPSSDKFFKSFYRRKRKI